MPSSVGPRCTVTLVGGTSAILIVLFFDAKIASERSKPTFLASTSNAATNLTSRTWYRPNVTCIRPGTVGFSSASNEYCTSCTSEDAQFPTPTMATRTSADACGAFCSLIGRSPNLHNLLRGVVRWCWGSCRGSHLFGGARHRPFGCDELVEPLDLALAGFEPELMQLAGVAVERVAGPR